MRLQAIPERCSGCTACRLACALANYGRINPALAALTIRGQFPVPGTYDIVLCDQCGACAKACPVDAIAETDGVFRVDEDACIACYECVDACPHGVMFAHPTLEAPIKCTLCRECVEICPRDALVLVDA